MKPSKVTDEQMIALLKTGLSQKETATRLHVSHGRVSSVQKRHGIPIAKHGDYLKVSKEKQDSIVSLIAEGELSDRQICFSAGVNKNVVVRIRRDTGVGPSRYTHRAAKIIAEKRLLIEQDLVVGGTITSIARKHKVSISTVSNYSHFLNEAKRLKEEQNEKPDTVTPAIKNPDRASTPGRQLWALAGA